MSRTFAALALASILSGCLAPGGLPLGPTSSPPEAGSCGGDREASGGASLVPGLGGDEATLVRRVAAAVGDEVLSDAPNATVSDARAHRWDTREGGIGVSLAKPGDREEAAVPWWTQVVWMPRKGFGAEREDDVRARLERYLEGLGATEAVELDDSGNTNPGGAVHITFWQVHRDRLVGDTGGIIESGRAPLFYVRPSYQLPSGEPALAEKDALAVAKAHLRCVLDEEGRTEEAGYRFRDASHASWSVREGSLAYRLLLGYTEPVESHCGFLRHVHVDAGSGAVLAVETPLCD